MNETILRDGIEVLGPLAPGFGDILTPEALEFVASLARSFGAEREMLLERRVKRQAAFDRGELPDFLEETASIRSGEWRVASPPADLLDRRVEITGPVDRKMVINALNSGARVFMADFEDSNAPTWNNNVQGQLNLRDAVRGAIEHQSPEGKRYRLNEKTAVLMVRPRGWHLLETHLFIDGKPVPAALFDFGLFFFHNARSLLAKGTGPYFYLPKMESHLEARLWNKVFNRAQDELGIPRGSIRATVLIETLPAAFEMEEILYELREHSAGLNCGRWDYIFSFIKKLRAHGRFVLPDRGAVTMTVRFLRSYSLLLIQTCHRRGAHAMGGMAAQIPIKNDPQANEAALAKVVADKKREAEDGHDGTWVAHPGLVPVAMRIFDEHMPGPNQLHRLREDVRVTAGDLLEVPQGKITEQGLRANVSIGIQYLEAWLRGTGCVPLYNLMEDAATAEISRAQVWQWIRHDGGVLEDGRKITSSLVRAMIPEELKKIAEEIGEDRFGAGKFHLAAELFESLVTNAGFSDFLTLLAYPHL